ncbi:MAG TPA: transglycosylase domain-containing protein, partial [Candidatus Bathyarchaeia archaeon]|nr:transglycosylase domain-containing protein [Candidatus Bathyarchaeia archaeon]
MLARKWRSRYRSLYKKTFFGKLLHKFGKMNRAELLRHLAFGSFVGIIALFLLATVLFAWYAKDLPQPDKIVRREGFSTKIYDRNQVLLYDVFADQQRTPVEWQEIPQYLREATVAIEDKNFYEHHGFDPSGWLRAIFNIVFRGRLQGGSTLTQQLVKNVLLSPKRTITRKMKEFALAIQIEKKYSKDDILRMYLNEAPYGGTAWGVGVAAETYFSKEVKELNLVESAVLAGLPQRPSYYSPFGVNPKGYLGRTKDVLRRMREDEYINKDQEEQALKELENIEFSVSQDNFKAPHFVMYVKNLLEERYGERMVEQGGLKVYTTLDWEMQKKAQEIVAEEIKKVEDIHITNGAAMVMDPQSGEILSMVGSKDFSAKDYDGQVNVCLSLRQPGSAIKPVTYMTALKRGFTPATMIADVTTKFRGGAGGQAFYTPKNYDGKSHGPVQLRQALGSSLNIASVKLLALIGVENMLRTAYEMGISTFEPTSENINRFGLSVTLGGGDVRLIDMISAYSSFANGGFRVEPVAILEVKDQKNKTLEKNKPIKGKQVLSEEGAFLISHILADNEARLITFGPNSLLNITGRSVAVKTGTTDDMKDNWTIGWTPGKIVAVWVGNNDNSQMKSVASGVSGASPIWRRIILESLKQEPIQEFSRPQGIVSKEVDVISGYPSHDGWSLRTELFIKGTEPSGTDPIHTKLKVCKSDAGKLASETMVAKGEYEEKEFIVLKEDDPLSGEPNYWQEGIDAWVSGQSDEKYKYPRDYCETSNEVIV